VTVFGRLSDSKSVFAGVKTGSAWNESLVLFGGMRGQPAGLLLAVVGRNSDHPRPKRPVVAEEFQVFGWVERVGLARDARGLTGGSTSKGRVEGESCIG